MKENNAEANLTIQNNGVEVNFAYKDDKTYYAYIRNDAEANFSYKDNNFDDLTDITHLNTIDYFEDHN